MNTMLAGRELDALVAEKVMGLRVKYRTPGFPYFEDYIDTAHDVPRYSTDIAAAWAVVEKIHLLNGLDLTYGQPREGGVPAWRIKRDHCGDEEEDIAIADTVPLVICRAALKVSE